MMISRKSSSFLLCSLGLPWQNMPSPHAREFSSLRLNKTLSANYQDSNWLFGGQWNASLRSKQQYANFSSFPTSDNVLQKSEGEINKNPMEVEIISRQDIKPVAPTPQKLRVYKCSILDTINPHIYVSSVYFYPNNHKTDCNHIYHDESISKILKQSLSETLTKFYPLAGKVQDERHIDCNDDGVFYVEAKVNDRTLSEFLVQPDNKSIHQLLPFHPNSKEFLSQTYVTMIQVTTFSCGGISICLTTSHKICDGYSFTTFLKAWAATARGYPGEINPSFTSPSIFLPNLPAPPESLFAVAPFVSNPNKCVTKRIVFRGSSIKALKKKVGDSSSRVMAVTGFIWKCAMDAASKARLQSPRIYNLLLPINIRERSSPPFPPYSIGNIAWMGVAQFNVNEHNKELSSIVGLVKNAVSKVDSNYIEKMKGEKGNFKVGEYLNEMGKFHSDNNAEYMAVTSFRNDWIYGADFGWGKPVWASWGHAGADIPFERNVISLMETRSGDGIEAWVSLREEDMSIFEKNSELLEFASVNPSPLDQSVYN